MLREFSVRRIVFFRLYDWLGTLAMLALAAWLRAGLLTLPAPLIAALRALDIPFSSVATAMTPEELAPPAVYVFVALLWPFFLSVFAVYEGRANPTLKAELLNVLLAICVATLTLAGALYFTYRETPRVLAVLFFALDVALLLGGRIALWTLRRLVPASARARRAVLIVGAGPIARDVARQLRQYALSDIEIAGFSSDGPAQNSLDGLPILGPLEQLPAIVAAHRIRDAVVALPLEDHVRLIAACRALQGLAVRVYVIPDLFALSFPNAALDGFGGIPVVDLGRPGITGRRRVLKRVFDIVAVALSLLLIAPLLLLIALAIKLESRGPVLFRQERVGERGRPFTMYKFRSMRAGADPAPHRAHVERLIAGNLDPAQLGGDLKLARDPRVTRVGRLLRRTSLDELPQLFNVLIGDMSLVGPRPPIAYEVALYQDWHRRRLDAPPGISGLWQVKGRNRVSFDEMVRLDLEYIEKQSLWLDLQILAQTPLAVLSGRGAG
jgi:exopolysaccharide biosynthesis polyprenyl glycosylphosphotransferase